MSLKYEPSSEPQVAKMLANMDRLERRLIADVLDPATINAKRLINDLGLPVSDMRRALKALNASESTPTTLSAPLLSVEACRSLAALASAKFDAPGRFSAPKLTGLYRTCSLGIVGQRDPHDALRPAPTQTFSLPRRPERSARPDRGVYGGRTLGLDRPHARARFNGP